MERMICQCCGEALHKHGDVYKCGYCGATYRDDQAERAADLLKGLLDDFKVEQLSNARRRLYETTHEKYPSSQAVTQAAGNVLSISPDDFMARVYLHSHDADPHELISLLSRGNVSEWEAKETVDWLVRSLDMRTLAAVKDFADRHLKGNRKTEALNRIEDEALKLDSGVYDLSLKRDVFLCYSTEDTPRVIEVMETFEENGLSCFAAFRNLRHGKGAQENYQEAIFRAMKNCRVFVFLSSNSSRDPNRKGVAEELDHLVSDLPKKPRVEYLLEDYPERMPILAKRRMAEAFPHLEYCREPDDLIVRVSGLLNAEENAEKDRVKKLAEEASERAKKELQAEFEAREAARKEEQAKRQKELEERLAKEKEEREKRQREFEEERLRLEKEKLEIEKRRIEAERGSSAFPPVDGAMDAESMLAMLERAEELKRKRAEEVADRKKAEPVVDAIKAIGKVELTPECRERIDAAKTAYSGLTEGQRAFVHNADALLAAEREYGEAEEEERKRAEEEKRIDAVFDMEILPDGNASVAKCRDGKITGTAIPESYRGHAVTSIGESAFYECCSLASIAIPEGVTSIGESAFRGCSSLTSIIIPESVARIDEWAFDNCSSLKSISIPSSVTHIGRGAFSNCESLKSITVDPSNPKFDSRGGCNAIFETETNALLRGCANTAIPEGVTSIGEYAFSGYRSLTSITIPSSVTHIGRSAFSRCSSLSSIDIPNCVTTIGEYAFYECYSLTWITIPEGVTSIGEKAFFGCKSLTSITIPSSVTSIGRGAFFGCSSLGSIAIPSNVTSIDEEAFSGCSSLSSITIPEGVTSIGEKAFFGCSSLPSVTIPESVTFIGNYAFCGCSSLPSIVIPNGVTRIRMSAFSGCKSLTSVTIPESVTIIDVLAFAGCSSLASITIPESVVSISEYAFDGCSLLAQNLGLGVDSMKTISAAQLRERLKIFAEAKRIDATFDMEILPDGSASVANCRDKKITKTAIPESYLGKAVTSIGEFAFSDCSSLTSITIPKSVTSIGDHAFQACSSLKTIVIPDSVTSIGGWAFHGCSCEVHFEHKKPLFGYPKGFSKDCLAGFVEKVFWGGK